jgi:hypothetical protein
VKLQERFVTHVGGKNRKMADWKYESLKTDLLTTAWSAEYREIKT